METDSRKPFKRRKIHKNAVAEEEAQLWQQCHSGFDNEIILNEKLGLNIKPGKGRRKDSKLLERKTEEASVLLEKEVDIDWESSSSEDEPATHLQPGQRSKEPAAESTGRQQPITTSLGMSRRNTSVKKESFLIENVKESLEKAPSADREIDDADISDYDSSEEAGPLQVTSSPAKQPPVSPTITSTQSPLISSFPLSTQGSSDTSPIPSSQWVDKVRRGQQTTPCKDGSKSGHQVEEGKDSAKKKMKFTKCGFAEKLQKLINREKSDVAFWHHQAVSESAIPDSSCSVRIETINASRGLFVARCQNLKQLASSAQQKQSKGGCLPERLVVLFSRKTVEDHQLQNGTSLTVHPPWQTMVLPDTGETVLLCTYYCQVFGSEGQGSSSPTAGVAMVKSSQDFTSTPRPVFRPNRLFPDEGVGSKLYLNASILPQNKSEQISTSLLDTVSAKGPSFDFDFDLRGLVMRVCRNITPRPSSNHPTPAERWRILVQDGDGTIFEMSTVSSLDLTSWGGKLMDFRALKISQRVSRMSNPSLFSMIDSLSQPSSLDKEDFNASLSPKPMANSLLQSISYIVNLEQVEGVAECKDSQSLGMMNNQPSLPGQLCYKLSDVCQSLFHLRHRRVNFQATLLYAASQVAPEPIVPSRRAETDDGLLLFVADSSLSAASDTRQNGYATLEKLASCPTSIAGCSSLKELHSGSSLKFEDVITKEDGSLILDYYSNVRREMEFDEKDKNGNVSEGRRNDRGVTVKFPELTDVSPVNSLVTLTGTFDGVDQDTAYSWPACNICGSRRLEGDSSGTNLFCLTCNKEVASPVTKIHLEAIVKSPTLSDGIKIKVLLKQKTVTGLFGEPSSDEPFDLKRILGKPYGKTNCFVRKSAVDGDDGFLLEEI